MKIEIEKSDIAKLCTNLGLISSPDQIIMCPNGHEECPMNEIAVTISITVSDEKAVEIIKKALGNANL